MSTDTVAAATSGPLEDPRNYEEPEDYTLRQQLGLRPILLPANGDGPHPDQRPCPPWCWVGRSDGAYHHEVDWKAPTRATHRMEATASILASHYPGGWLKHDVEAAVSSATIEPVLEQVGGDAPRIKVYLRHSDNHSFKERLRLSIDDARELAAVLNFLVQTAEEGH